jgi:Protein of unknown function (DUF1822)
MNNSVLLTHNLDWDYEPQGRELIYLDDDQVEAAIALSQRVPTEPALDSQPEQAWQTYLNSLALEGFQQWLQERNSDIRLNLQQASLLLPLPGQSLGAICNLQVNQFRVCLILTESWTEDQILIPQKVITQPELQAHFYVAIALYEEQSAISIEGFFSATNLQQILQANFPSDFPIHGSTTGDFITVSRSHLNSDVDRLLLYFTCLESSAIPLSSLASPSVTESVALSTAPIVTRSQVQQLLVQPVINTAQWFQGQFAAVLQEVEWLIAPPLISPMPMRSAPIRSPEQASEQLMQLRRSRSQEFSNLLTELTRQSIPLSTEMRIRCQDLQLGDRVLQIYVAVAAIAPEWAMTPTEWSLLLILRSPAGEPLPEGLQFQVRDLQETLVQQTVQAQQTLDYLYANLIAACDEQFIVTVTLADQTSLTLPPIAFHP